ncbi:PKSKA1 [Whalleya microplaca]|nr:PKSKA1 [Whalleya microplaca]
MDPSLSSTYLNNTYSSVTSECSSYDESQNAIPAPKRAGRTQVPVAVVGMGCRLPGHSKSPTALWDFLQKGGVAKNEPPPSRFRLAGHYDKSGRPRTMKSPGGMFMEDVDPAVFDGQFFNISRADCMAMDPQQRQLLEVTYECLENSGITLEILSGTRTGIIVGVNFIDYGAIQNRDPEDRADSITIGLASSILSNRISHFLNVNGPSMTIDTACSASLVAVDVACRYLDSFQADSMLVEGANMWMVPEHNEEIGMMNMTQSASGKCHSFDAKADGYVKSEGVNAIYLKRLDDAIRDGDPIRAVIRGTAVGASGRTAGLANPSPHAQALVIRAAYSNAGITDFKATGFLECHGTGTLAGDPVEVRGAASVFAMNREDGEELIIGSIKSNIGHSEAAAGLSGLIKTVMVVENGVIPGTPLFLTPNPNIDWKGSRVTASRTSLKWPITSDIRRASVNSFGFGGANAHVVIEQGPVSRHVSSHKQVAVDFFDSDDEGENGEGNVGGNNSLPTVLVFSANHQTSLKNYVKALSGHLLNPTVSIDLSDLAYTLSERRSRHYYRAFSISRSSKINVGEETLILGKLAPSPPRIGFVFTGQGAQWSQMGLDLMETFPLAKSVIQYLDTVLQALPEAPKWTLFKELTEPRTTEALRQPEFSQPLVTALQLALLEVLRYWGIRPKAVVGHSSGEIAAAAAAGLITPACAIKTAFYRGQAAKEVGTPAEPVGMLAVGVGPETVEKYLEPMEGKLHIACYNSPSSLTLSGTVSALQKLYSRLQREGHFARMLFVDLAYHSDYMANIGQLYHEMLLRDDMCKQIRKFTNDSSRVRMFSSVTGKLMLPTETPDAAYWKENMVSPVKFTQAASELLCDTQDGADFLIELGPSSALSGPIMQIKKSLPVGAATDAPYMSALERGPDSTLPMYNMAGQLFISGGTIDLAKVNRVSLSSSKPAPSLVIDLPNYSWNHSTSYWHETQASKDWRFKKFINHDLLGSKMPGTAWQSPVFKKVLKLAESPWLRDHRLGTQVVLPAAAYITMAVEAMNQTAMMTQWKEREPAKYRYQLRDVKFHRALMLEENFEKRITLVLTPLQGGSTRSWYGFRVYSVQDELYTDHSTGSICVETNYEEMTAPIDTIAPLDLPTPASVWYKALADAGYNFGPCFQKHLKVEMTIGKRNTRSIVNLEPPSSSAHAQSRYPMHPAVMDACLQTGSPSLFSSDPSSVTTVLVPKVIDSLFVTGGHELPTEGITLSSATFLGAGNKDIARNYATNVSLYNPKSGALLFEMKGLASGEIETSEKEGPSHSFSHLVWDADIDMLMTAESPLVEQYFTSGHKTVQDVIDLVVHNKPGLKTLELNLSPGDSSSLWVQDNGKGLIRAACSQYHLALRETKTLISAKEKLSSQSRMGHFHLLDVTKAGAVVSGIKFDLAIMKAAEGANTAAEQGKIMEGLRISVRQGGHIIAVGINEQTLGTLGRAVALPFLGKNICICQVHAAKNEAGDEIASRPTITHVSLLDRATQQSTKMRGILNAIIEKRWDVRTSSDPLKDISSETVVVVLDELFINVIDRLDNEQWKLLKAITQQRCRLLWVTAGGHLNVTDPTMACVAGLLRTIRAEEQLEVMSLDVAMSTGESTTLAISSCLERLCATKLDRGQMDYEFVERAGVVHISRLLPDPKLNQLQSSEVSARNTETVSLHDCDTLLRLQCERLGSMDAINFSEAAPEPVPLKDGELEVEIYAAGLNYKDVVITMGIVPGDETALGHEAAGVITKVTPGVAVSGFDLHIGQRVVVFSKGAFANRVQVSPSRVHRIPDSMSFEEAATLSVAYLTSIHSLFDVANLTEGKRILIHSAAGGVGIAAVQLAQYAGAEVFATVSTDDKREFIKSTFGLSDHRIFYSRNTDFAGQILTATNGEGVDVVLNSLAGDMLNESFRILADGGIMVEIGKKDILDRNSLPMAPFDRNISFRGVDMSPERVPNVLVARLMSQIFKLIDGQYIKPISPIHRFSWTDLPSAMRFIRAGNHMGKIVLSDDPHTNIQVPVRRAPKVIHFHDDACYLVVGGLRGLCGSLAIYLAKSGAKNLAVISRSGHTDDKSQNVVKQINALGSHIDLLTADINVAVDVEKALKQTAVPVAGIIQGAMILRDRPFNSMSITEYHEAMQCKVNGTWNLHNTAEKLGLDLQFFTMLSSISGVVGNRGQANYSAANVFLDSFAEFRNQRGQAACSVNLGVIEDAGFIAENAGFAAKHFDSRVFKGINYSLLRKILYFSILQQQLKSPQTPAKSLPPTQMVTGLITPQPADSFLRHDARFSALFTSQDDTEVIKSNGSSGNAEVQALLLMLQVPSTDSAAKLAAMVAIVNNCLVRMLRLSETMDPARPFSVYGIDSLSAVEVRNWVRSELGALVTTLDIMNATSLRAFCEKIVAKLVTSDEKK